jgi:hypothetical protein
MVRERMPPAYAVAISYEKDENLFMCVVFKLNYKYKGQLQTDRQTDM